MSGHESEFCDTNILIYGHDASAGAKHTVAARLLRELIIQDRCRLSPQVLQEFYVNVTRKIARPMTEDEAAVAVSKYAHWATAATDARDVQSAIALARQRRMSLWDALIVVSALKCDADVLWTEDLQHGASFGSLQVRNPFVDESLARAGESGPA